MSNRRKISARYLGLANQLGCSPLATRLDRRHHKCNDGMVDISGNYTRDKFCRCPFPAMICTGEGELTEYVRFGLGIRFAVTALNGGLVERDRSYVWKIGKWSIPLPIYRMLGKSYVEEMPISDLEYQMKWTVTHPLFGETFAYSGRFVIVSPSF